MVNGFWLWDYVMLDILTVVSINTVLCLVGDENYCRSSPTAKHEINSVLLLQKLGSVLVLSEFRAKPKYQCQDFFKEFY